MLRTLLKGTTLLVGLIAAVMMIGCAGVTPVDTSRYHAHAAR